MKVVNISEPSDAQQTGEQPKMVVVKTRQDNQDARSD
jgi:hypothetical protein